MTAPAQPQFPELIPILDEVRKELLDLGLRNPLLNYRPLKSRGLEVVGERPADIYRILVAEGRIFSFLPEERSAVEVSPQIVDSGDDDAGGFHVSAEESEKRFVDTYLQTSLTLKNLQARLLATYYSARTSIEEQGVNTLFLALGMLNWREADSSEETHRAPHIIQSPASEVTAACSDEAPQAAPTIPNGNPNSSLAGKYQVANLEIDLGATEMHLMDVRRLALWLSQVAAVESPVFWLEATRRVVSAAGIHRLGSRIQDSFQRACQAGHQAGLFTVREGFIWRTQSTEVAVRDRSDFPQSAKKIEYIAPEEIRLAIERVAEESYGIAPDDVAAGACRLLGFGRATDEIRSVIDKERDVLIANGRLSVKGDSLVCTEGSKPA